MPQHCCCTRIDTCPDFCVDNLSPVFYVIEVSGLADGDLPPFLDAGYADHFNGTWNLYHACLIPFQGYDECASGCIWICGPFTLEIVEVAGDKIIRIYTPGFPDPENVWEYNNGEDAIDCLAVSSLDVPWVSDVTGSVIDASGSTITLTANNDPEAFGTTYCCDGGCWHDHQTDWEIEMSGWGSQLSGLGCADMSPWNGTFVAAHDGTAWIQHYPEDANQSRSCWLYYNAGACAQYQYLVVAHGGGGNAELWFLPASLEWASRYEIELGISDCEDALACDECSYPAGGPGEIPFGGGSVFYEMRPA